MAEGPVIDKSDPTERIIDAYGAMCSALYALRQAEGHKAYYDELGFIIGLFTQDRAHVRQNFPEVLK